MTEEEYAKRKAFAGQTKPSMQRRRVGHDYTSRRMYLVTMVIEGRRQLLGRLEGVAVADPGRVADADPERAIGADPERAADADPERATARVVPTPLGQRITEEWYAVTAHHPEVSVVAFQLMPDHLHGILFVEKAMSQHLGAIISGFKASTNRAYRQLLSQEAAATPLHSQPSPSASPSVGPSASPSVGPSASPSVGPSASSSVGPSASPSVGSSVGCAAASPQLRRDRSRDNREQGLLWQRGYNDHILSNEGELERWRRYIADNPRRLYVRRQNAELFRVSFGLRIGPFQCSAVGNRYLLDYPHILQVQCSTHFYEEDIQKAVAGYMAAARGGAVLVSPSISTGEKRTMRTAFDEGLPLILITANGLGEYSKPGGAYFDACAQGRLLILSPFERQNRKVTLTRRMCMEMNELARLIAEGSGAAAQPTNGTDQPTADAAAQPTGGSNPSTETTKPENNETEVFTTNSPRGTKPDDNGRNENSDSTYRPHRLVRGHEEPVATADGLR